MKKLTVILILMISVFTSVFAERWKTEKVDGRSYVYDVENNFTDVGYLTFYTEAAVYDLSKENNLEYNVIAYREDRLTKATELALQYGVVFIYDEDGKLLGADLLTDRKTDEYGVIYYFWQAWVK